MGRSVAECLALAWGHGGQGTDSRLRLWGLGFLPSALLPLHKATSNSLKKSSSKQDTAKTEEDTGVKSWQKRKVERTCCSSGSIGQCIGMSSLR